MTEEAQTSYNERTNDSVDSEEEYLLVPPDEQKMGKLCCVWTSGVFSIVLLVLGILVAIGFDPLINSYIEKELVIRNGTEFYDTWVNPPIVPYLKIYFFNVTNTKEVLKKGEKPNLVELGPYSYREHWKKVNVSFNDNGTVSYQTLKEYHFDLKASSGPESDVVHTINVPVTVAVDRVKNMGPLVQLALSSMLTVLNESAFVEKTVKDLVWGYSDPLLVLGNNFLPADKQIPFTKFGFFYQKNGSTEGVYSINTGERGFGNYSLIDTFNSSRHLKYWNTPECNAINGTDGTSYPPFISKQSTLYLFNENLCRSLPLTYNNSIQRYGIDGYRFTPPADVFGEVSKNPENKCFCVGGPPCIGGGVFNISACKYDAPTFISWPHFYQADQKYLDAFTGLKPNSQKHALYIDVIPRMGSPLAAQARVQINFQTRKMKRIEIVRHMPEILFPVVWFEDGVTTLPEKVVSLLQLSTNVPRDMKLALLLVSFIGGGILLMVAIVSFALWSRQSVSKLPITSVQPTRSSSSAYDSEEEKGHTNPAVSPYNPDA